MDNQYSIREATLEDLDQIVNVVLVSMQHDPQWNYRFVHREKYPEDHHKYTRLLFEQFISPLNDDWFVVLAETKDAGYNMIVGFSVWDRSYIKKKQFGSSYEPQNPMAVVANVGGSNRRDVAPRRQARFRAVSDYEKVHFFNEYGDQKLHLQILGVHPSHWRRKAGTKLVRWGMNKAGADQVPVTLMAGSVGFKLYSSLGFKHIGNSITQVPGEEEMVDAEAMVYQCQPS